MRQRLLGLTMALCLSLGLLTPCLAAQAVSEAELVQVVSALGIMKGDAGGGMALDRGVTRAEFITMAVKATPGGDRVGQAAVSPFPDVPQSHWASGFVEAGVKAGYLSGYTDGTFRPQNPITLAEGVTIVLKVLGYSSGDFVGAYPSAQMALYHSLDLDEGMTLSASGALMTRRDAMRIFYNMLTAPTRTGTPYLTSLGYPLTAEGEVDVVALVNQSRKGPVVAAGDWRSLIPFDVTAATVHQNKNTVSINQIQEYDLVYWSESMNTLWVYSDRVTGAIENILPSQSNPQSVTVAGRTYAIETSAAAYALSNLGQYGPGDRVTLLLGQGGGVAGLAPYNAGGGERVGLITALGRAAYSEPNGDYSSQTVTILATDGMSYTYPWYSSSFKEGDLVRVQVGTGGEITLFRASSVGLSGQVSTDGSRLGSYPLAEGVEILDTYEATALRLYPSRLAGVTIAGDSVRYYALNAKGEISRLVLKDATGDLHRYGILTEITDRSAGMVLNVLYEMDLEGQEVSVLSQSIRFSVQTGPIQFKGSPQSPGLITSLTAVAVNRVDGRLVYAGNRSYTLSDRVLVYRLEDGRYQPISLERLEAGDTLTAYYDKAESQGGLVRVIVAK